MGSDYLRHPTFGWGDTLAIFSSLFYAGYFLATQRGRQYLDTLSYIWMVGVCSTLVLLVVCLGLGLPLGGYPPKTYLALLGAALISQLGGYLSVGYALGHLPASAVSPTMIGQPVMTALLALPLLGEAFAAGSNFGRRRGAGGYFARASQPGSAPHGKPGGAGYPGFTYTGVVPIGLDKFILA